MAMEDWIVVIKEKLAAVRKYFRISDEVLTSTGWEVDDAHSEERLGLQYTLQVLYPAGLRSSIHV